MDWARLAVGVGLVATVAAQGRPAVTFAAGTQVVLVPVRVTGAKGAVVRGLEAKDFTVREDGMRRPIASFAFRDLDAPSANVAPAVEDPHRMVVLYFDYTAMERGDAAAAVTAARGFISGTMRTGDQVAIASWRDALRVDQTFTPSHALLNATLDRLDPALGFDFDRTDPRVLLDRPRKSIEMLGTLCDRLGTSAGRKELVVFSAGFTAPNADNLLTATIGAARKNNVALYTLDATGNVARNSPGRDAIAALATNTGGSFLFDTADFSPLFTQVEEDAAAYYDISFYSALRAKDGAYHRVSVALSRPGIELSYRPGYTALKAFRDFNAADRRRQLEDQLTADDPERSLPLRASASYARDGKGGYSVQVTARLAAAAIPAGASLDLLAEVHTLTGDEVASAGTALKSKAGRAALYAFDFSGPAGVYLVRIAVRENQTGQMGWVGTTLVVPTRVGR